VCVCTHKYTYAIHKGQRTGSSITCACVSHTYTHKHTYGLYTQDGDRVITCRELNTGLRSLQIYPPMHVSVGHFEELTKGLLNDQEALDGPAFITMLRREMERYSADVCVYMYLYCIYMYVYMDMTHARTYTHTNMYVFMCLYT
jgi:hypothetical protein